MRIYCTARGTLLTVCADLDEKEVRQGGDTYTCCGWFTVLDKHNIVKQPDPKKSF